MHERSIEDQLRAEYFGLLPEIRKVAWQLETEIRFHILPTSHSLSHHEQLIVKARVKDCESAIKALQRRQEGRIFNPDRPEDYSLLSLPDLAGVRVLIFPRARLVEVDNSLAQCFHGWTPDPVRDESGAILAPKYSGFCRQVSDKVRAEYQVVPMLIGFFWEVEHSAMYKPDSSLRGIGDSIEMRSLKASVEMALSRFEEGFGSFVAANQ